MACSLILGSALNDLLGLWEAGSNGATRNEVNLQVKKGNWRKGKQGSRNGRQLYRGGGWGVCGM